MMELVERAIPVIQHLPEASELADAPSQERVSEAVSIEVLVAQECRDEEVLQGADLDDQAVRAGIHTAVERLRVQHAQLTSGAILQTYRRQVAFEVENSRPAVRVLSVQG